MASTQISSTTAARLNSGRILMVAASILGGVLLTGLVFWVVLTATSGTASSQRDPLAAPAAVAFRQAEHASAVDGRDALAAPGLAAFRQSEHASVTTVSFADSERADNYGTQWSKDPLAAPNIVSFRQSEHAEAGR